MKEQCYQILPPLSDEEYEALKADIAERGVQVPVEFDEEGNVLDGFHRVRACQELNITDYPKVIRHGLTREQKLEHALILNMARRQLTKEQKNEIAIKLRQQAWMQERIGKVLGVGHQTVGRWIQDVVQMDNVAPESSTELTPTTIADTQGRKQPASKPRKKKGESGPAGPVPVKREEDDMRGPSTSQQNQQACEDIQSTPSQKTDTTTAKVINVSSRRPQRKMDEVMEDYGLVDRFWVTTHDFWADVFNRGADKIIDNFIVGLYCS